MDFINLIVMIFTAGIFFFLFFKFTDIIDKI